jgi:LTXXQ motif family protein
MNRFALTALATLALGPMGALAQDPAHDSHHPAAAESPAPAQATPPAGQAGGSGQQDMMGNMPMMMNMMGMMHMMAEGPAGMAIIDHIEGHIAFLRTELKITDAQANAWNALADALRANAKKLGEVRTSMMARMGAAQQQTPTLAERLNLQEQWLAARLEGTRAIKSAFTNLYGVLSDDQKKTANELLGPQMGLGMMAMGQMQPGQMGPGQMGAGRMQPGQMPGAMQRPPAENR